MGVRALYKVTHMNDRKYSNEEMIRFLEPVLGFCLRRLDNRADAEDLAGEIILCALEGMKTYKIDSLDAWVWRIAHNRYANFIRRHKRMEESLPEDYDVPDERDFVQEMCNADAREREYAAVFRSLHTLSRQYRDILVDHYIGGMPVKAIGEKYGLPQTTVKWRLNAGRERIRQRMETNMERIYRKINWTTTTCNGSCKPDRYLNSQISRAICEAAYEKPLTVDEISMKTGIPALYIEDELPRLTYGDAIAENGGRYGTDFIILRRCDREVLRSAYAPHVSVLADFVEHRIRETAGDIAEMGFTGCDRGSEKLGWIAMHLILRSEVFDVMKSAPELDAGPYPPRKDGGYGWFLIEECADEKRSVNDDDSSGCNIAGYDSGSSGKNPHCIYYYHIGRYFDGGIYHNGGTRWMVANDIAPLAENGIVPDGILTEEDTLHLLEKNLVKKTDAGIALNFPHFTEEEFDRFAACLLRDTDEIREPIRSLFLAIRDSFRGFVPARLDSQINQYVSCMTTEVIGYVAEELIRRGVLEMPDPDRPMTNGVLSVMGEFRNI